MEITRNLCLVSPAPEVFFELREEREIFKREVLLGPRAEGLALAERLGLPVPDPSRLGLDDGIFYPPTESGLALAAAISGITPEKSPRTEGNRRVVVLLVDFPELRGLTPKAFFEQLLFGNDTALSVSQYYDQASGGLLKVTGDVFGWFTLPNPLSYYADGKLGLGTYPHNAQKLAEDAIEIARESIDFSKYDLDGDGMLDGLVIVHAGAGAENADRDVRPSLIWSHKWLVSHPQTIDGITIYPYTLQPENGRVGVFCHEFGHFLGLPDLYDTTSRSYGVGAWCVMGTGSWLGNGDQPANMSAWCRAKLGWSTVEQVMSGHYDLKDRSIVRINPENAGSNEYFLLEKRVREGLDSALPGEGFLIWHIDDAVNGNTNPKHYQVGLEQADGESSLEFLENQGDEGDPFRGSTGNDDFADATTPNSKTYLKRQSGVRIHGFAPSLDKGDVDIEAP